jgi:hypothetical protein
MLILLLYAVMVPLSVHGADVVTINGEISALKVLEALYGNLTVEKGNPREPALWRNISMPEDLKKYYPEDKDGEVFVAFEAKYEESGIEKYVLVTQTRPANVLSYSCHQCAPLIGCFVFRKSNNSWIEENQNRYVGIIGKWGWINKKTIDRLRKDTVELIKVGPEKHGVLIRGDDVGQGYENYYFYLIVPHKDSLRVSLRAGIEGAGPGACSDLAAKNRQKISLAFDKNDESEYYGVTVIKQWNKGPCKKVTSVKEIKMYSFADGVYAEKSVSKP